MLEDLKSASEGLRSALTRYLSVCSNVRSCTLQGGLLHNRPLELADQIQSEVEFFTQYESQLSDAKVAIHVARNNVPSVVPINRLPQEILVTIFHFVLAIRPRTVDSLPQVCSRWRSISLSTCSLWTRIEYRPPQVVRDFQNAEVIHSGLLDYANLHLSRSGSLPVHFSLDIDMDNNRWRMRDAYDWYNGSFRRLLDVIKIRVQSLQLHFGTSISNGTAVEAQEEAISNLLLNSTRGALIAVELSSDISGFIAALDNDCRDAFLLLDLTSEQLDEVFASVEVLHLNKLCPIWTSTAYHDLVDLRLIGFDDPILDTTLVSILGKSPRLRIFYFGLSIKHQAKDSLLPVQLAELEVLKILGYYSAYSIDFHKKSEFLLSLIHPGGKPLCLHLGNESVGIPQWNSKAPKQDVPIKQIKAFVERSNLAELHASDHPLPLQLLPLPRMRYLVLRGCSIRDRTTLPQDDTKHEALTSKPPLATLYLSDCSIDLEFLRSGLRRTKVQRLIVYGCSFFTNGQSIPQEEARTALCGVCPVVLFEDKRLGCMYS